MNSWNEWLAAQERAAGPQLARTRDIVLAHAALRPGETLLDLGAGRGLIALGALERLGPSGRVIACDLDPQCLATLRTGADRSGRGGQVHVIQADITALPLPAAWADVATTRSVLEMVPDRPAAAREAFRVLRSDGRISGFEPLNSYLTRHHQLVDLEPLGDLGRRVTQLFEAVYADPNEPMLTFDERDLVRILEDAGFVEVGVNFVLRWERHRLTEEEARLRLTQRGAATRPTIMELVGGELGQAAAERYADYFARTASLGVLAERKGSAFIWGRKP